YDEEMKGPLGDRYRKASEQMQDALKRMQENARKEAEESNTKQEEEPKTKSKRDVSAMLEHTRLKREEDKAGRFIPTLDQIVGSAKSWYEKEVLQGSKYSQSMDKQMHGLEGDRYRSAMKEMQEVMKTVQEIARK
ncbi:unnamed protein product, partial [Allacma fusca]